MNAKEAGQITEANRAKLFIEIYNGIKLAAEEGKSRFHYRFGGHYNHEDASDYLKKDGYLVHYFSFDNTMVITW